MLPIATDVTRSVVCVLVSLTDIPCKNGWTDQDAVWGLTLVGPRNHILYGGWDSPWQGAILGLSPAHWKALGVCGDYVTRDNSIVNNGMTAWLPQLGVTFPPPWKILPLRWGLSLKFFNHYGRSSSVVRSGHVCEPCRMTEPIEMPFGMKTWMGPRNHVLEESRDPTFAHINSGMQYVDVLHCCKV